jgi:carbamoyl-phosphate synthase large subunit
MNVLFTSIGRRVELIRAFRSAFEDLRLQGEIIGLDRDPLAPALQECTKSFIVPSLDSPDYIPVLVEIFRRGKVNLVFPLIDPDIPLLADNRELLESTGARLAVVSQDASRTVSDKHLTTRFFRRLGLPVPHTWLPQELDPNAISFPLFVKPRGGSAGANSFQARNANELRFFLQYVKDPIIQEWLPGPEITNDVVCDLEGNVLSVVSRKRLEVRTGEVSKGVTIHDARILEACLSVARELPVIGPVTVQCMMKDQQPYFTEINARFAGGIPLSIAAGANAPLYLLARTAGIPLELPPLGQYKIGLHMTRYDDSFFLSEEQREDISRRRL